MKPPAKAKPFGKVVKREPSPKQTRAERKYEAKTGRNPRLGYVRGRGR